MDKRGRTCHLGWQIKPGSRLANQADFLIAGVASAVEQALGGDDHTGNTVATLAGLGFTKGFLQRMEGVGAAQPFDRGNDHALHLVYRQPAGWRICPIDQHLAGVAFFQAAAIFGPFEPQVVA
jgi:hypothetical protein